MEVVEVRFWGRLLGCNEEVKLEGKWVRLVVGLNGYGFW